MWAAANQTGTANHARLLDEGVMFREALCASSFWGVSFVLPVLCLVTMTVWVDDQAVMGGTQ